MLSAPVFCKCTTSLPLASVVAPDENPASARVSVRAGVRFRASARARVGVRVMV